MTGGGPTTLIFTGAHSGCLRAWVWERERAREGVGVRRHASAVDIKRTMNVINFQSLFSLRRICRTVAWGSSPTVLPTFSLMYMTQLTKGGWSYAVSYGHRPSKRHRTLNETVFSWSIFRIELRPIGFQLSYFIYHRNCVVKLLCELISDRINRYKNDGHYR